MLALRLSDGLENRTSFGALRLRVLQRQLSKERPLPQPVHPIPIVRLLQPLPFTSPHLAPSLAEGAEALGAAEGLLLRCRSLPTSSPTSRGSRWTLSMPLLTATNATKRNASLRHSVSVGMSPALLRGVTGHWPCACEVVERHHFTMKPFEAP